MSALTMVAVVNVVPLSAPVPDGVLTFPIPATLGWLIVLMCLAAACALLALATARGSAGSQRRQLPSPTHRAWRPRRREPQPS
jgi:hypothetical protein